MATQSWNNLIEFIKVKLGVPTNLLELSDEDIRHHIKEHILPHFSNYISKKCWIKMDQSHLINDDTDPDYNEVFLGLRYRIPVPENCEIIDVYTIYMKDTSILGDIIGYTYAFLDPRDTVMWNTYHDMVKSMTAVTDYEFYKPNIIQFGKTIQYLETFILECRIMHTNLSEIPSDVYQEILKPWCLGEIMTIIAAQRSKYENLSTQFGPLPINWERLESKGAEILQEVYSKLDAVPPEYLIAWID